VSARTTVTVAVVPPSHRTGPLVGTAYAVVERQGRRVVCYHLPETEAETAMGLIAYSRQVAKQTGARWVKPAPWIPGADEDAADVDPEDDSEVPNPHLQTQPVIVVRRRRVAA